MSSRKGTILLEELIDKAEARARQNAAESGVELSEEDISRIAIGAIKFTDFAADRRTGILFDWNRMFSLQGFSGPYVQYAGVRVKSILTKLGENDSIPAVDDYDWLAERELLLHLHTYPLVIKEAAQNYEPHKIAAFAYELARLLNRYYEQTSIADSPPELQLKRLWLLGEIRQVHEHALGLLGIEVPSKM
jgi:arginyl-tRNA synthetase